MPSRRTPFSARSRSKLIKPGLGSHLVIARFEAEKQVLALMDHPNIARVLDAGTTGSGRPYFVMELVGGEPINRFCDQHHLSLRSRLELFVPVCQAVQHAHQKGIIHRDLKPSNVLVALYDGRPVPKVIDFGVAKAIGPESAGRTAHTEFGSLIGTLEFMSPEQAGLDPLDVDTRSDIYSLGVILYELLTGSTPLARQRPKQATVLELLRIIREVEPPRPSNALHTDSTPPAVSASRPLEPGALARALRGELDWIIMKALEKDRDRRYSTANGLALDLLRHLNNEPVQACPPTAMYRFRKLARRNRAVLTTIVLVGITLIAGTAVSTWQAIRAVHARQEADRAAAGASSPVLRRHPAGSAVSKGRRFRAAAESLDRHLPTLGSRRAGLGVALSQRLDWAVAQAPRASCSGSCPVVEWRRPAARFGKFGSVREVVGCRSPGSPAKLDSRPGGRRAAGMELGRPAGRRCGRTRDDPDLGAGERSTGLSRSRSQYRSRCRRSGAA